MQFIAELLDGQKNGNIYWDGGVNAKYEEYCREDVNHF